MFIIVIVNGQSRNRGKWLMKQYPGIKMQGNVKVIGMDCATDAKKVGLAMGVYNDCGIALIETKLGSDGNSIAEIIMSWIQEDDKVIFAIDAPLGWPENLGNSLYRHLAGQALSIESNLMFRRETDRFIKKTLGNSPLTLGLTVLQEPPMLP